MSYTIYHADGTPVPIPNAIIYSGFYNPTGGSTGAGLGVQLVGDRAINYGAPFAQSILQLTENFASTSVPADSSSLQGQLWFRKDPSTPTQSGVLYVRTQDNTSGGIINWQKIATVPGSGITPLSNLFCKISTDSSGLITSTSSVTSVDITTSLTYTPVNSTGDTMSGLLVLSGNPTVPLGAATKQYVDSLIAANGVNKIIAGSNITITPSSGSGNVTINANIPAAVSSVTVAGTSGRITTSGSPITSSGTISVDLNTSGVTAGTYTSANIAVDAYGRVTSASSGAGSGVGFNQSWVTYTIGVNVNQRNNNTVFYNTGSTPITVMVGLSGSSASGAYTQQAYVNGILIVSNGYGGSTGTWNFPTTFVVPPGLSYKVVSGYTINYWSELR